MRSILTCAVRAALPLFLAAVAVAATPVERHGRLSVKGNRILDQGGNPVQLRGMALYWSQWKGQFYNAATVKWLVDDWKCNIVRASMAVENGGYLSNPEAEKNKVKVVVQAAIDLGIYVIIDWHDHNAMNHTSQAKAFFEEMARLYGKYPNVIYETYNEPLNNHTWAGQIKPYHLAVIPSIRAQDPDNIIVCGTRSWSQDVDEASKDPIPGENIAYTLHYYAATHKGALRDKAAAALRNGVALMVTEYGTAEANGSGMLDAGESKRWWAWLDANMISHCNWSIADLTETTAALRPGASPQGGWSLSNLSASGVLVREEIRTKNNMTTLVRRAATTGAGREGWPGTVAPGWIWGAAKGGAKTEGMVTGWRDARGRVLRINPLP